MAAHGTKACEMTTHNEWIEFSSGDQLADGLADKVAQSLAQAIEERGQAVLAVSGGTTPKKFFHALSMRDLDWARVSVTLVDERFVPGTSSRSNAALVQENLLTSKAAAAKFVGLYQNAATVEEAAQSASQIVSNLNWPLDVAILGMGADGHTASFFPDADNLSTLLDLNSKAIVLPVHAQSAGEPRLTLSLARLLEARFLAVHIEGQEKRNVLEDALKADTAKPISAVFAGAARTVPVYWAG